MPSINFFVQDIHFSIPKPRKTSAWINRVILKEKFSLKQLNYIFCSDEHLRQVNIDYLNHRTYTDIITFNTSELPREIEGDIFISVERVRDNAKDFGATFQDELHRVMIHGVLHLMGYSDDSARKTAEMRKKEDACLSLR